MDDSAPLGITASARGRRWRWRASPLPLGAAQRLGVDDLAAALLLTRGCAPEDVARTLNPALRDWLPDPSIFLDMDRAAARLADAILADEAIVVFADYDVDGATSAAFMLRHLAALGARARPYIPDRLLEGYGPSAEALLRFKAEGAGLVLLLDCGTQAFGPLAAARDAGLDIIVIDHHKASTALPPALALVNPNRLDESAAAGFGHLCTAGLAFLMGVALNRTLRQRGFFTARPEPRIADWLDIVALGTVADVVPLTGLNRAFVSLGLKRMARRECAGIAALCDIAGLARAPRADDLGFHLGPRINAGGRVGDADLGVRLLVAESTAEAAPLAHTLDQLNHERRAIEAAVLEGALQQAEQVGDAPVAVVAGIGWHPGVVGIVAARLKERLNRPALVLALDEDGVTAKGSGRSIPGVDLGAAILAAKAHGLIREGGGHAMAVGVTVEADAIPALAGWLAGRLAEPVAAAAAERALDIDLSVAPQALCADLVRALEAAGPYGQAWPAPRVAVGPVRLLKVDAVGRSEPRTHLRFVASGRDGGRVSGIAFGAADTPLGTLLAGAIGQELCLAGRVAINEWQGRERVDLQLDDAALAG